MKVLRMAFPGSASLKLAFSIDIAPLRGQEIVDFTINITLLKCKRGGNTQAKPEVKTLSVGWVAIRRPLRQKRCKPN